MILLTSCKTKLITVKYLNNLKTLLITYSAFLIIPYVTNHMTITKKIKIIINIYIYIYIYIYNDLVIKQLLLLNISMTF